MSDLPSNFASGTIEVAPRRIRLAAALLDSVVSFIFAVPAGVIGYRLGVASRLHQSVPGTLIFTVCLSLVCLLVICAYQLYLEAAKGQTLGRRWMKIRIAALDGSNPGFVRAILLRRCVNLAIYLFTLRLFGTALGLSYLMVDMLFVLGPNRRCIHDLIAGTKVVRAPTADAPIG
jgi:uncharacterized RDD family membrane protein YckC